MYIFEVNACARPLLPELHCMRDHPVLLPGPGKIPRQVEHKIRLAQEATASPVATDLVEIRTL
jgi:hypothetical protein